MRTRPSTLSRVAIAVLTAGTLLTGCTAGGSTPPAPTPTAPTTPDTQKISPANLPQPPKLRKPKGAVKDTTFGDCATAAGNQQVSGTIKNTAEDAQDFVITMNWTNDTYDVLGRGIAVVRRLDAGQSANFTLKARVATGATTCTPNVVGGELA